MSDAHAFCRVYLSRIMTEVRAVLPQTEIGKAWAWKSGRHVEFHGPGDFYWHGRGCCLSGTPGPRAGALGAVEKAVTAAGGASLPQS